MLFAANLFTSTEGETMPTYSQKNLP